MKIIFMGTADFAVPALEAVAEHVVLVVAQPDRPSGRGLELRMTPVKQKAVELGLPIETPEKARSEENIQRFQELKPDVLLVAAYGQILSTRVLETAKYGGVNLHGSILPKYRGAAPIQRCIMDGESETGVTLMQMDKEMDTGDIITIEKLTVGDDETAGQLFERLSILAANMARDWMPRICSGDYPRTPQAHDLATYAPKIEKSEGELNSSEDAQVAYNRFRALTPFPGATMRTRFGDLKVVSASLLAGTHGSLGTVVQLRPELAVQFQGSAIVLQEVKPEGKRKMTGADWANGVRIAIGDSLTI